MEKIKIGLSGIGRMGSHHLAMYERMAKEGFPVEIKAVCDVDDTRLDGTNQAASNIGVGIGNVLAYSRYTDLEEMLAKEDLDAVDIIMPTYLHSDAAVKVLESGRHCMCEKPMALNKEQCDAMIAASEKSGKYLMIGHCLRFWREYLYLEDVTKKRKFGECLKANFWRGGFQDHVKNPSWQDWIIKREKGGGGLFDQHIHDTDFILWLFGVPETVTTNGKTVHPQSAYDIVSTMYGYKSGMPVFAHDDVAYKGYPFGYGFTVSFEYATVEYANNVLTVYPENGEAYCPDVTEYAEDDDAYYNELKYFLTCIINGEKPKKCTSEESALTVSVIMKEMQSADLNGEKIRI